MLLDCIIDSWLIVLIAIILNVTDMRAAFLIRCSTKKQDYERQVNDLTRLAKKFGYTSSDNLIFGEHITGKDDASKRA